MDRNWKNEVGQVLENTLIYVDQDQRLIQLLYESDVISQKEFDQITGSMEGIRPSLQTMSKRIEKIQSRNGLLPDLYQLMNVLLECKDYEERLVEGAESKIQFPQSTFHKRLLEYCICQLDLQLLNNAVFRKMIYTYIFRIIEYQKVVQKYKS
ncbi:hypothetical protein Amet_1175 [Alkaliphilus metalliredigens QYMF]|uniref:Uncharacterized protein n=1 Tax=Alkaliphilus metalliredigens (strain QYMF) TaxID=293826 RepID=A6TMG5_ALKMQ|nr:hypothetical protein [Alkaliphilus metalliredigens]ABR47383.1 hypothetical protein Amet_1175 [Alkaliphilus metalliredigens QYMF]